MKLLLAEDERDLNNALTKILEIKGYEVDSVFDGQAATEKSRIVDYDGIILDVMMPVKNGFDALLEMRQNGINTPVLMLTAKSEVEDRVRGLETGADDYLAKPFVMEELLARINAMVRRQKVYQSQTLCVGNTVFKAEGMELSVGVHSLRLTGKEASLLAMFMNAPGRSISREQIIERIWKEEDKEQEKLLLYISYLQSKLQSLHADITIIETDKGYCLSNVPELE